MTASWKNGIEAKISDFDVKGAIRVLCSEDYFAPVDEFTIEALKSKHSPPSRTLEFPSPPNRDKWLQVDESEVRDSIMSFGSGSSSGTDGFYPQYFKDLISMSALDAENVEFSS